MSQVKGQGHTRPKMCLMVWSGARIIVDLFVLSRLASIACFDSCGRQVKPAVEMQAFLVENFLFNLQKRVNLQLMVG